jgi:hypothetical protein
LLVAGFAALIAVAVRSFRRRERTDARGRLVTP